MRLPETLAEQLMLFFMLGFFSSALLFLVVLAGTLWRHAWAWMDDAKPGRNPVTDFLARLRGWVPHNAQGTATEYFWWKDRDGKEQYDVLFSFAGFAFFLPLACFLSFRFYPVLLAGLTLIAVAFVARFARRHKKLFDKHLKDPDAHK